MADEAFVCIRKLNADQTAANLLVELEKMFQEKSIDATKIRFSGLDGTNTMSGIHKGLGRRISHLAPHGKYCNCRNHRLALCLVHLMRQFDDVDAIDKLLLALWKTFKYSTVKNAIFENAQVAEEQPILRILKVCVTRWLTHGQTAARVIGRYKSLVAALDTIYHVRSDCDAKGLRDELLNPSRVIMLLLLAEVLVPINNFCQFLQTKNLNYSLMMEKFSKVITKVENIQEKISSNDFESLKFFPQVENLLDFSRDRMVNGRNLRSSQTNDGHSNTELLNNFMNRVGDPFLSSLIDELQDAKNETWPVFSGFDLFNPMAADKSLETRRKHLDTLLSHYGQVATDTFEGQTIAAAPLVNSEHARTEFLEFVESFEDAVYKRQEEIKIEARRLFSTTSRS